MKETLKIVNFFLIFIFISTIFNFIGILRLYDFQSIARDDIKIRSSASMLITEDSDEFMMGSMNILTINGDGGLCLDIPSSEMSWSEIINEFPPGLSGTSLAYDSTNEMTIMFGGYRSWSVRSDTWAYDFKDNEWIQMSPSISPLARYGHSMVYDSLDMAVILFGGNDGSNNDDETWVYDYKANE